MERIINIVLAQMVGIGTEQLQKLNIVLHHVLTRREQEISHLYRWWDELR